MPKPGRAYITCPKCGHSYFHEYPCHLNEPTHFFEIEEDCPVCWNTNINNPDGINPHRVKRKETKGPLECSTCDFWKNDPTEQLSIINAFIGLDRDGKFMMHTIREKEVDAQNIVKTEEI